MKRLLLKPSYRQSYRPLCSVCRDALDVMIKHNLAVVIDLPRGDDFLLDGERHYYEVCTVEWRELWQEWSLGFHWVCGWSANLSLSIPLHEVCPAVPPESLGDFKENLLMLALAGEP